MRLHYERKRLEDIARREAAGESLWTDEFPEPVRVKVLYALRASLLHEERPRRLVLLQAKTIMLVQLGWKTLDGWEQMELGEYLEQCDDSMVPTVIEAIVWALEKLEFVSTKSIDGFTKAVNKLLVSYRIAFELVNGQMVEFDSQELHAEVVVPTLKLLAGRPGWESVEATYQKALREIGQDAGDAITDAGTALQDALSLLGLKGNQLGDQIRDAKKRGLLLPHDERLSQGVEKFLHWAAANRSERGDAHPGGDPTRDDAWLMIHVTGALILRLARQADGATPADP